MSVMIAFVSPQMCRMLGLGISARILMRWGLIRLLKLRGLITSEVPPISGA